MYSFHVIKYFIFIFTKDKKGQFSFIKLLMIE